MALRLMLSVAYALPFGLALAWFLRRGIARRQEADRTWRLFADLRGLRRVDPQLHRYEGENEGYPFVLDLVWDTRRRAIMGGRLVSHRGREQRLWTRMGLFLPGLPIGFRALRHDWRARLFGGLLGPQIATGDGTFDGRVYVTGAPEGEVLGYLTPSRRLALLQSFSAAGDVRIEGGWLRRRWRRRIHRRADLESAYAGMGAVAQTLAGGPLATVTAFEPEDGPRHLPCRAENDGTPWLMPAAAAGLALVIGWELAGYHDGSAARARAGAREEPGAAAGEAAAHVGRAFELWELHPDDRVRFVTLRRHERSGSEWRTSAPYLAAESHVLSENAIGASLSSRSETQPRYGDRTYVARVYTLAPSALTSGIDVMIEALPHIHRLGDSRLLSIGVDPQTKYTRRIVCVAVPSGSGPVETTDFQPYERSTVGAWDLLFYDTTSIDRHASIHVRYRPDRDASPLDWSTVVPADWRSAGEEP